MFHTAPDIKLPEDETAENLIAAEAATESGLSEQTGIAPHKRWLRLLFKRRTLIRLVTLVTLGSGIINLWLVITPPPHAHRGRLHHFVPLEFFQFPRSFQLLIGFALIVSAINIHKRKQRAYQLVLALSALSFVLHLGPRQDTGQALLALLLGVVLIATHRSFTVRSSPPDWRGVLLRMSIATLAAFGYGVGGFWLLDRRQFGINFNWADSIHRTLLFLTFIGDAHLTPHTRYAAWFLDSLYVISTATLLYAGFALFRPIIYRFHTLPHERVRAQALTSQYGRAALDYFKLWPDKSYFFSESGRSFVAYRVAAHFAIVLADPVGPPEELAATIEQFRSWCEDNGWGVAFHQTLPDFLPVYQQLGFKKLKVGDEAIVDLTKFNLDGRANKKLRHCLNHFEKAGFRQRFHQAPVSDELLRQLREISDDWLTLPGRRERTFTLGSFDPHYLRATPIVTVEDATGCLLAFVNIIPSYRAGEATFDLMRHRVDAPNAVMDFLLLKLIALLREQGFTRLNLGMAPLGGFQDHEAATSAEKALHLFFQRLTFLFSFGGLRSYKAKFADIWEPRYVLYRHVTDLPKLGLALSRISEIRGRSGR
ncbi:MAG: phosphatidylglycerol lysyltransferase domain-containing protein [Blastocatellia bacterium]